VLIIIIQTLIPRLDELSVIGTIDCKIYIYVTNIIAIYFEWTPVVRLILETYAGSIIINV